MGDQSTCTCDIAFQDIIKPDVHKYNYMVGYNSTLQNFLLVLEITSVLFGVKDFGDFLALMGSLACRLGSPPSEFVTGEDIKGNNLNGCRDGCRDPSDGSIRQNTM